ncbi:precorrin-3B C(17)-methyltransferase [Planosporangium flavigriseum]|uniref:Precorrin-3B C(17)-methyltransferase n=1 Tax=Planosporangium flavigriseum TaxID=373681 RepID=A0A8J3LPL0_9ACTN|nr:precorrin-3B C(17)-methyltransferase [Planosporangium flavigriseum]NJC66012.1 precorrin-3B C(17)-methyltransferase [Planosporangium flavigriseum]GIG74525.1 precorrin-3B C(17)-methyltransferase [Planosporangium flavigriseum]
MIALVTATAAGRALASRLAAAWPEETTIYDGPVADQIRDSWPRSRALVCFLATGATVRLVAPLLRDKHSDPAVVCVDESGRFAVALLGGHGGGANDLAARVSAVLGAQPVVTTATDASGVTPLDTYGADLGFRLADPAPVARVTAAVLGGTPLRIESDQTWPLPALAAGGSTDQPRSLVISDRVDADGDLVYRPPSLVVGVGASRNAPADEIDELIAKALAEAGVVAESVRALATVDLKADEPGIVEVARRRGWPLLTYPAETLRTVDVPNPSEVVNAAVGTPSVAEAAALTAAREAGRSADLIAPKRASAMATVAVARLTPRGRLAIVGLGPGAEDLRTPRATAALRRAGIVVGLDQYVDQVRHLLTPGTRIEASGLGAEEERARTAVELATAGHAVALIGSGDAGVYAMASPALQLAGNDVDVEAVPGITAALAASALLGAPLGHDHAYLSLSDLHTPWPVITERLRAAAAADLVVCLYNPRSRKRQAQFDEALAILREHRPDATPVGLVRQASRADQRVTVTTLADLAADPSVVDMFTVVLVGSTRTEVIGGRMVTPREYRWLP